MLSLVRSDILNSATHEEKELKRACFMCAYVRVDVRVRTYTPRLCMRETTYSNKNDHLIFDDFRFNIMEH